MAGVAEPWQYADGEASGDRDGAGDRDAGATIAGPAEAPGAEPAPRPGSSFPRGVARSIT